MHCTIIFLIFATINIQTVNNYSFKTNLMSTDKKPKWDIGVTIDVAPKAVKLADTYKTALEKRLQPDELEILKAGGEELRDRHSGQSETLTIQKSKTIGQEEAIRLINSRVVSIHGIVESAATASPEIRKAFGIGTPINRSVDSVKAAANTVITAYNDNTDWSNMAGIINEDITELNSLLSNLSKVKDIQSDSMIVRKLRTMDKTVLQRTVEDLISKVSAIGVHVFAIENPAVAKLFSDLIPSSNGKPVSKTTTAANTAKA